MLIYNLKYSIVIRSKKREVKIMDFNNENNLNEEQEISNENSLNNSEDNYISQFDDIVDNDFSVMESISGEDKSKKKFFIFRYINPSIFIAICVFLVALIAFGVYWVFGSKTITGTWVYKNSVESATSSADEAVTYSYYYTFEKPDSKGKGTYVCYIEGQESKGDYTISNGGDKQTITLGNSEFVYDIKGIKLFGNAELSLTQEAYTDQSTGQEVPEQTITMEQGSEPDLDEKAIKDYKVDDKLIGKWDTDVQAADDMYGYYPCDLSIEFMENGIMGINKYNEEIENMTTYFAYTIDKNNLKLKSLSANNSEEESFTYQLKDGVLTFEGFMEGASFYKHGEDKPKSLETTTQATEETTKADNNKKADKSSSKAKNK